MTTAGAVLAADQAGPTAIAAPTSSAAGTIAATASAGIRVGDTELMFDATRSQARRPAAMPRGSPIATATRMNDITCQATMALIWRRVDPRVLSMARSRRRIRMEVM